MGLTEHRFTQGCSVAAQHFHHSPTNKILWVDKTHFAPLGIDEALEKMGETTYQLLQDFAHPRNLESVPGSDHVPKGTGSCADLFLLFVCGRVPVQDHLEV